MTDSKPDVGPDFHDPRDEFRNGFIAAVTHLRGQLNPTESQIHAATNELCVYRLAHRTPEDEHPVRSTP